MQKASWFEKSFRAQVCVIELSEKHQKACNRRRKRRSDFAPALALQLMHTLERLLKTH